MIGGALLDLGNALQLPSLPWLVLAGCGLSAMLGMLHFRAYLETEK
jgi:hypothetical protein